jgi:acetyl-CoA carboxylase biotin carboxylase subunit
MKNSPPIEKGLVANRGEIAVRIQRACHELGLQTVQVYSSVDANSLAVQMADESICIGPPAALQSYLNKGHLIEAAKRFGAQAIHPGYGFLSEKADFAQLCEDQGLIFIGPSAKVIAQMGDKSTAKKIAMAAGVPTTPGSDGNVPTLQEALSVARAIGFPVLLKASAGGGGKGMRIVNTEEELERSFNEARREAMSFFADESIYIEKYLMRIRHIEVQVLADSKKVLIFGERDCSIQRRNQKLIEESPSWVLDAKLKNEMFLAAAKLCEHVGYRNAGTIEFILDEDSHQFFFMEMNTRIQVEHPVTEMVTSFDLVKAQIQIAAGEVLSLQQKDLTLRGHAIECRINAEDPRNNFSPCPGVVSALHLPGGPGVRIDSHLFAGYTVPIYYDSLLAKVICWGHDRAEAMARMKRVLTELRIDGVTTTKSLHLEILDHAKFIEGDFQTRFLSQEFNLS